MSRIRLKFTRGEEVKYISHLDMMMVFERAARRAHLPIAYSQGFNPHPQMVFGLPMSVGVTSEAEYADFEMAEEIDLNEFIQKFNGSLPKGFEITDAQFIQGKANIMATISKASYLILVSCAANDGIKFIEKRIDEFLAQSKIPVKKESKSGTREVDIRPMIHEVRLLLLDDKNGEVQKEQTSYCMNKFINNYTDSISEELRCRYAPENCKLLCISVFLSAGSAANLKPDLLVTSLSAFTGVEIKILKIHRTGLYVERDGRTHDPLDFEILNVV